MVDGDTIVVQSERGTSFSVRLLGIDCLETRHGERLEKQARALSISTNSALVRGRTAEKLVDSTLKNKLIFLESEPGFKDKYGRKLAYVWYRSENQKERPRLLNQELLTSGNARLYESDRPLKYQTEFKAGEEQARRAKVGLWSNDVLTVPTTELREAPEVERKRPWFLLVVAGILLVLTLQVREKFLAR